MKSRRRAIGGVLVAALMWSLSATPALAANGRLEGQMVDSVLGLQADGICVTATHEDGNVFSAETSSGGFQFLDIPLGLYTVEFEDCDQSGFGSRTFTDVTPNPGSLGSTPIIRLRRTHGFAVSGRVTDRHVGAQLKDVCVTAYDAAGERLNKVETGVDGYYAMAFDTAQPVTLKANECESGPLNTATYVDPNGSSVIRPTDGQTIRGADIGLTASSGTYGVVTDSLTGAPLAGLCYNGGLTDRRVVGSNGAYFWAGTPSGALIWFTPCGSYVEGRAEVPTSFTGLNRVDVTMPGSPGLAILAVSDSGEARIVGGEAIPVNGSGNASGPRQGSIEDGTPLSLADGDYVAASLGLFAPGTPVLADAEVIGFEKGDAHTATVVVPSVPEISFATAMFEPDAASGRVLSTQAPGAPFSAEWGDPVVSTLETGGRAYAALRELEPFDVSVDGFRTIGHSLWVTYETWDRDGPATVTIRVERSWIPGEPEDLRLLWNGRIIGSCSAGAAPCVDSRAMDGNDLAFEIRAEHGAIVEFATGPSFVDTSTSVFVSDIEWLAASGVTRGCNPPLNDLFCPDDEVTRGQMAAFLVRALNLTDTDPNIEFSDLNDSVFQADIEKLATAGITTGCGGDRFCPDNPVTRGQMAAFLVRALDYTDTGDTDFTDDNNSVFEADIERLAAAGVTTGCGPTTFCPNDNVTRGQMAAFLRRALDN